MMQPKSSNVATSKSRHRNLKVQRPSQPQNEVYYMDSMEIATKWN